MADSSYHGIEREREIRQIAARLGVADFVFTASPVRKGAALREASGDGLLVVGSRGAVLQAKAREPEKGFSDSEDRAVSWLKKQADKARSQGRGTKRELARLKRDGAPLKLSPVRAATLENSVRVKYDLELTQVTDDWPIIVVLDHPKSQGVDLGFEPDAICLTFEDWRELHRRLRSTSAMLDYARRVLEAGIHVPLGREVERYQPMSEADKASVQGSSGCVPLLAPLDEHDELGADLFHDVIEKVWPDDGPMPWRSADEYRQIVEFLDAVPPAAQAIAGRWFLKKRAELASGQYRSSGLFRLAARDRLVFGCSALDKWPSTKAWTAEFSALTALRHTQALETGAPSDTNTLGVAALVETRGGVNGVSYYFLMLKGAEAKLPLPDDLRGNLEWRYGIHDHAKGTISEAVVASQAPCPCLSGKKFEDCCSKKR